MDRDVRYSSITTTAAVSENVLSQHVRLLEDSINNSQANCVDGSVLWVSLMRKIGINAFLVLTPKHCYAGFYADRDQKICFAIETTLLGEEIDSDDVEIPELFDNAVNEDLRDDASFASFVQAMQQGTTQIQASASKAKEGDEGDFLIIDIARMRKLGILPIAFQNKSEFVSRDQMSASDASSTDSTESDEEADESDQ